MAAAGTHNTGEYVGQGGQGVSLRLGLQYAHNALTIHTKPVSSRQIGLGVGLGRLPQHPRPWAPCPIITTTAAAHISAYLVAMHSGERTYFDVLNIAHRRKLKFSHI